MYWTRSKRGTSSNILLNILGTSMLIPCRKTPKKFNLDVISGSSSTLLMHPWWTWLNILRRNSSHIQYAIYARLIHSKENLSHKSNMIRIKEMSKNGALAQDVYLLIFVFGVFWLTGLSKRNNNHFSDDCNVANIPNHDALRQGGVIMADWEFNVMWRSCLRWKKNGQKIAPI